MKRMRRLLSAVTAVSMSLLCLPGVIPADAAYQYGGEFHISIDRVQVGISEIGQPVPVYVRCGETAYGFDALEFGVTVPSDCQYHTITSPREAEITGGEALDLSMTIRTGAISGSDAVMIWNAGSGAESGDKGADLVLYMVSVPDTAKVGDRFALKLCTRNVSGKGKAICYNMGKNLEYEFVTADGWIEVTENPPPCGACGENLSWEFDEAAETLTISGTGEMQDWQSVMDLPWRAYRNAIRRVVLRDGVTAVGERAFQSCAQLLSAEIPDSVTDIGDYAFHGCPDLTLCGDADTAAEAYAGENDIPFTVLTQQENCGDVSGDGTVNAADAARILIAAAAIGAGGSSGLTAEQEQAANVNRDSAINASDAAIVLQFAAAAGAGQDVKIRDYTTRYCKSE